MIMHQKHYTVKERLCRKIKETTGIEIKIQNWGGNRQLLMEVIAVEYFLNSIDPSSNEKNLSFIHI